MATTYNYNVPMCFFFAVTEQNVKQYVFFSTLKTWGSAQSYCRTHYTDLVTINSEAENLEVKQIILGQNYAWIGLYRVPWLWSDKTQNSFQNQGSVQTTRTKLVGRALYRFSSITSQKLS
uniref:C-type lectin domain-containing protein n=1 Tax=Fundulus heteroclitus TaxID=8078 RepID=A0A3Q2PA55_FUNHE